MTVGRDAVDDTPAARIAPAELALLASVFVVAACGLVYELAAGALASYLLGDSVLQFSTVIGCYLFAMGIGSWLGQPLRRAPAGGAVPGIELLVGLVGGLMPAALFVAHSHAAGGQRAAVSGAAVRPGAGWWACWWGWRSRW
jgi:spermidine synthase